ncbi:MAG: ABC transporter permease [Oscillospiraceae bacterium]|nr:ABC transporter permease [Oscillospiraceae bacterium]
MTSFLNALPGAVSQGLIWGIMAIGLYITYRILNLSDLTVDGSFCTGGVVCVMLMVNGCNVWVAMLGAFLAGVLTGLVTGFFHTKCGIPAILAGILTQLGLWSVNLAIMGMKANTALNVNNYELLVSLRYLQDVNKGNRPFYQHPIFVVGVVTAAVVAVLYWFFGTERGASLRATGANENMARAQGINTNVNKVLGLALANGLVAFSGALLCQYQSYAEINMGRGAIVIGLASIIIGEVAFGRIFRNFAMKLLSVSLGAVIYYIVIQAVISLLKIDSNYLKLISALIVAVFLAVPYWNENYFRPWKEKYFPKRAKAAKKEG